MSSPSGQGSGQRVQRVANEIRELLGELLSRGDIKDPRVRAAGLLTFTHVKVTGDLREATAYFVVHGADRVQMAQVRKGLNSAAGYIRRAIGDRLRMRNTPSIEFSVDRVFESEARVDKLLQEIADERRAVEGAETAEREPPSEGGGDGSSSSSA